MSAKSQLVSFRLSDDRQRRLTALAAAEGLSPGEYARKIVFERLDLEDSERQTIEILRTEFAAFRADFATAIEALLVAYGSSRPLTPELAKRWVNERLRHAPSPPTSESGDHS